MKKAETTLDDVLEAVQGGFGKVEKRLDKVERRLDGVERRITMVDTRMGMVENRMSGIEDTNRHLIRRVGEMEGKMDEVQEVVEGLSKALDHDTIEVIQHERRIKRLEKVRS